jgi:hypothetical protein
MSQERQAWVAAIEQSGLTWRKSTASGDSGGQCVEVASSSKFVFVRDSRNQGGPGLVFSVRRWTEFLSGIR